MTRVVIVGGGIVGCATAYFCARDDMAVTLIESERVAFGASGRNPGFVWLHCRNPGFGLQISLAGRALYDELASELPPFGFRPLLYLVILLETLGFLLFGFGFLAEQVAQQSAEIDALNRRLSRVSQGSEHIS